MFGNVTALEEWHVTGGIQELKHDARMLQAWRLVFSDTSHLVPTGVTRNTIGP